MTFSRQPIGLGPRAIAQTDPARVRSARIARVPRRRGTSSRMRFYGTIAGLVLASVAAVGIGASLDSPRSLMTRQDFASMRGVVQAQTRVALAQCRDLEGSARPLCRSQARADERVRMAELELRYRGTVEAVAALELAKARARRQAETRGAST